MIVVDTSVWIAYFNKVHNDSVAKLKAVYDFGHILVGDLVLLEVLQGARTSATPLGLSKSYACSLWRVCSTTR